MFYLTSQLRSMTAYPCLTLMTLSHWDAEPWTDVPFASPIRMYLFPGLQLRQTDEETTVSSDKIWSITYLRRVRQVDVELRGESDGSFLWWSEPTEAGRGDPLNTVLTRPVTMDLQSFSTCSDLNNCNTLISYQLLWICSDFRSRCRETCIP